MIRNHWHARLYGAMVLAAAVGFASGCTLFDEILPGTPFTPDQPVAEVTVVGTISIERASGYSQGCSAGTAFLSGTAKNTGDLDVDDVYIEVDALNSSNAVLGTYRVHVFNGEVSEVVESPATPTPPPTTPPTTPEAPPPQIAGTSLAVKESGIFEVCTRVPVGDVAGTAYRTDFVVISEVK